MPGSLVLLPPPGRRVQQSMRAVHHPISGWIQHAQRFGPGQKMPEGQKTPNLGSPLHCSIPSDGSHSPLLEWRFRGPKHRVQGGAISQTQGAAVTPATPAGRKRRRIVRLTPRSLPSI